MKKFLIILLTLACLLAMAACGGEPTPEMPNESNVSAGELSENGQEQEIEAGLRPILREEFEPLYEIGEVKTEKAGVGTASVITVAAEKCSPAALEDWYFNHVLKTEFDHYLIKYSDSDLGCAASKLSGEIYKDIIYKCYPGIFDISFDKFEGDFYAVPEGESKLFAVSYETGFPEIMKGYNTIFRNYGDKSCYTSAFAKSEECTKEALEKWYYTFGMKDGFYCHIVVYSDTGSNAPKSACITPDGEIYSYVTSEFIYGEFNVQTFTNTVQYFPAGDGKALLSEDEKKGAVESVILPKTEATPLDFSNILSEVNGIRADLLDGKYELSNEYYIKDTENANLITREDARRLTNVSDSGGSKHLSYEEALEDIDLLFRALKTSYGAYYYFGGDETFGEAKEKILDKLKEYEGKSVSREVIEKAIYKNLGFVRDMHASFSAETWGKARYSYYYIDMAFEKREDKFYTEIDGKEYYYVRCAENTPEMKYTLKESGEIVYAPVLFEKQNEVIFIDTVILSDGTTEREVPVSWTKAQNLLDESSMDVKFETGEKNRISYLVVRSFDDDQQKELEKFVASGRNLRGVDILIFDIRSNGGGGSRWCDEWTTNFAGRKAVETTLFSERHSNISKALGRSQSNKIGTYSVTETNSKVISNDTTIIVLVDENCGSSGESMLNKLRAMENVIVVGSNSAGCVLCGNQIMIKLPNSNTRIFYGLSLGFFYDTENYDYKGFEPDIWCDPQISLDAVINMVEYYGLKEITE